MESLRSIEKYKFLKGSWQKDYLQRMLPPVEVQTGKMPRKQQNRQNKEEHQVFDDG